MAYGRQNVSQPHQWKGRGHQVKATSNQSRGKTVDTSGNGGQESKLGEGTGKLYVGGAGGQNDRRFDAK